MEKQSDVEIGSIRGSPRFVVILSKLMRLHDRVEVHRSKEMREGFFRLIDLLILDFVLQLAHIDLQKKQTSFSSVPAFGSLGVLRSSAQMDKSFL